MKVLLTNDDGISATGLQALRRALLEVPGRGAVGDRAGLEPQRNCAQHHHALAAVGRGDRSSATTRSGFATDGTPVDCVRFAALGLIEHTPELIVSGINHGANLGDDITYSGTVAAALEGIVLGIPAIAVSQQADHGELHFARGRLEHAELRQAAATFTARLVEELERVPMPAATLLNVNCPVGDPRGATSCRLGKRIYRDRMELTEEGENGRRRYRIYGERPDFKHEPGTDFAAIAEGQIAVTPLHFDLTDQAGVEELAGFDLDSLLRPAAREV